MFEKAPKRVRQENLRSLKLLNNYMDRLKERKAVEALSLKFYATEKENSKSKRFLRFEVDLEPFDSFSRPDSTDLHHQRMVNRLFDQFRIAKRRTATKESVPQYSPSEAAGDSIIEDFPELLSKSSAREVELHSELRGWVEKERKAQMLRGISE